MSTNYWTSYDGHPPPDMPKCGYDGSLCDYTTLYITIGVIIFLAGLFLSLIPHFIPIVSVTVPLGYLLYVKEKERMLYDMTWRIPREQVRLLEVRSRRSGTVGSKSFTSDSFNGSVDTETANARLGAKQANANGVRCSYKRFQQTRNITFNKEELSRLKEVVKMKFSLAN